MKDIPLILALGALALGAVAVLSQLWRMGRIGGKPGPASLWLHRIAGYIFLALMTFLFVGMLWIKVPAFGGNLSPRDAWHAAAGFAVVAFMWSKWAIVRPFRGLLKLAPALGVTVFGLAFVVVGLVAVFRLI